jgi:hypothetical protein
MGKLNCERNESCCVFHTTTPCATSNLSCYETNIMLLNPTKTRFATNFLMVERLFKFKLVIEQIVANLDWTTFVNTLHGNHH